MGRSKESCSCLSDDALGVTDRFKIKPRALKKKCWIEVQAHLNVRERAFQSLFALAL